jgi:tRNA-2-methylthio-N6-dimethylallyladenosine synthase
LYNIKVTEMRNNMAIHTIDDNDIKSAVRASEELKEYFSSRASESGRALTYNLITYGCQLNESDSEKLAGMLESFGLVPVQHPHGSDTLVPADVIVMNTCAIRENAEDRLFGNLGVYKKFKKDKSVSFIAVCGCMMKIGKNVDKIRSSYPYVDLVFDPQQLHRFPELMLASLAVKHQQIDIGTTDYLVEDRYVPIRRERRFRALLPIMYGCNNFCNYCVVPYTRGRERSRNFDSVKDELRALADEGYREVMLLGQNVNSYRGADNDGNTRTFLDVLDAASSIKEFSRVRFMSSHPKDLSQDVLSLMGERDNIEKHLHLALQSGSDRVLRRMNRPYDLKTFLDIADSFRKKVPGGSLTTDIIVGFPGETEEDFELTLEAVRKAAFDAAFTFEFSARPGTPAYDYEDQIPKEVVSHRFARLLEIQNDLAFRSNSALIGKTLEVLTEGISKGDKKIYSGRTITNHLVNFEADPEFIKKAGIAPDDDLEGALIPVRIDRARPYSVDGVMAGDIIR